ncbi:hypothetical protein D9M69_698610 [compost metagenome]
MHHLGFDAVPLQELDHRGRDLGGLVRIVAVGDLGPHGGARARWQRRLHGQEGEVVLGAEHLVVGGQVGQHLLGVGAAIHREQDFHRGLLVS